MKIAERRTKMLEAEAACHFAQIQSRKTAQIAAIESARIEQQSEQMSFYVSKMLLEAQEILARSQLWTLLDGASGLTSRIRSKNE